ncbi:ABC transporter substrate-binding protein [Streptomyces cellostaticus]|uniref:ABC transporter substrate-binding protein n=1 Tax=Streptomyces cellostaticus TaxID=67285 RepID=A0A101NQ05_9ACTN|nr:ABC transporter substrate-binding protein [Streptomyces cellostaticus]KUM97256.1 ABC transporter substrate-binding protein [Streptomyces cellostaticus]GHI03952.1 ABC transporter substrate-binding protein [Streptomyces cellostaticus]
MNMRTCTALATALVATLALGATACSGGTHSMDGKGRGKNPALANQGAVVGGTPKQGGTLTVLSNQDFTHLDPARNWVMSDMEFGTRLLYRTLVTYKAAPGTGGSELVPDLATDLGTSSHGAKTWTFHLKKGIRYEDGTPVTAQDVKYNVERSFSPDLPGGADYAARYLAGAQGYQGPAQGKHLDSIRTPDDHTIVFELRKPFAEFPNATVMPTFAPVPKAQDTGPRYDNRPFSSGPYKIQSYGRGKQLVLVRNQHWDPKTDEVRKAYPDKLVVVMGLKGDQIDDRLIASQGPDASAVSWGALRPESAAKVLPNAEVRKRLLAESTNCTDMVQMHTGRAPFDDVRIRRAVQYALDKDAVLTASGGPAFNDLSTAYMPATLFGGKQPDLLKIPATGDVAKARQLLKEAGKPDGFSTEITVSTGDKGRAEAIQQSLGKAGIKVTIDTVDPSAFYATIGDTTHRTDLVYTGWCPDYPSGSTFLPFVFDGRYIKEKGNSGNHSLFRDKPTMQRMDEIAAMTDAKAANRAWQELDGQILQKAPAVPVLVRRWPLVLGSNIAGAYGQTSFGGQLDYASVGLKDPSKSGS